MNADHQEISRLERKVERQREKHFGSIFMILWCGLPFLFLKLFDGASDFFYWLTGFASMGIAWWTARWLTRDRDD